MDNSTIVDTSRQALFHSYLQSPKSTWCSPIRVYSIELFDDLFYIWDLTLVNKGDQIPPEKPLELHSKGLEISGFCGWINQQNITKEIGQLQGGARDRWLSWFICIYLPS